MAKAKKFFKSRTGTQRDRSPEPTPLRKRTKLVYDFNQSASSEQLNETNDLSADSGLEESSSFAHDTSDNRSMMEINSKWNRILNICVTPGKTYQRSPNRRPLSRVELNISTSTPIKKRNDHKPIEKVDLWDKAMNDDPQLRKYIMEFNDEIESVQKSELIVKETH